MFDSDSQSQPTCGKWLYWAVGPAWLDPGLKTDLLSVQEDCVIEFWKGLVDDRIWKVFSLGRADRVTHQCRSLTTLNCPVRSYHCRFTDCRDTYEDRSEASMQCDIPYTYGAHSADGWHFISDRRTLNRQGRGNQKKSRQDVSLWAYNRLPRICDKRNRFLRRQ